MPMIQPVQNVALPFHPEHLKIFALGALWKELNLSVTQLV